MARTKKVGANKVNTEPKKGGVKKDVYDYAAMVDANGDSVTNDDGKLTMMPPEIKDAEGVVTQQAYDSKLHLPLKKSDFADEATHWEYRAYTADLQIQRQQALADQYRKKAENLRKFGDEKTRKKASKLQKMTEQMAALKAELGAEGIDIEELLAD